MNIQSRIPAFPNQSLSAMDQWFNQMYLAGLLYHPDDPAETIICSRTGLPTFTAQECDELNKAMEFMFAQHDNEVYKVGLRYFHKAMNVTPEFA